MSMLSIVANLHVYVFLTISMPLTYYRFLYKAIDSCHYIPSSNLLLCSYEVVALWIKTVGHQLKSDQHGSMAAQTAPYGRLPSLASIVCNAYAF